MDASKKLTNDTRDSVVLGDVVELGFGLGWEPWAKKRGRTRIGFIGGREDREGSGVEGLIWNLDTKADDLNLLPNFMVATLLKHNDRGEVGSYGEVKTDMHADGAE